MNITAARSLYQRRASVIGWLHAQPLSTANMNPLTGGPHRPLGGPAVNGNVQDAFGSTFSAEQHVRGYAKGKFSSASLQLWGMVKAGDMELVVLAPFQTDIAAGIVALPADLLAAYNAGQFVTMNNGSPVAFDRFRFNGDLWAVKAPAVPDVDGSGVFAWRMPVSKITAG